MSEAIKLLKQIEQLNINQLADALEFNGYAECVGAIRSKNIDGEEFLKLTEVQISLWRLPPSQRRRLWSFIQQVRQDPTHFLFISEKNTKMTPKANTLNKSLLSKQPLASNLPLKTDTTLTRKTGNCNIKADISHNLARTSETLISTNKTSSETNTSTLSKQESKLLKNKLEQVFKKDSEDISNKSFIYSQKQPRLPPKPEHLKIITKEDKQDNFEDSSDDYNDGYLTPIKVETEQNRIDSENENSSFLRGTSASSTGSFLSRFRKSYTNLEIRPQVVENNYEEQNANVCKRNAKDRPLPPIPVNTTESKYESNIEFSDDEPLPEYTIVLENEDMSPHQHSNDDEQLPEYSSVDNDSDNEKFNELKDSQEIRPLSIHEIDKIRKITTHSQPLPNALPKRPVKNTVDQLIRTEQKYTDNDVFSYKSDDEQLQEYTPIVEDENFANIGNNEDQKQKRDISPFHRALPPLPIKLANNTDQVLTNKPRPKLPIPTPVEGSFKLVVPQTNELKLSLASSVPTDDTTEFKILTKGIKPAAELLKSPSITHRNLPKPPASLPKLPSDLLTPPAFLLKPDDLTKLNMDMTLHQTQHRPLPPLPVSQTTNQPPENIEDDVPYYSDVHFITEPCYRETDRKGARLLLNGLADGAFVIRPSRQENYICTFSIMHRKKMFNLGIEKDSKGILQFGSVTPNFEQPIFYGIGDIISYYSKHPLYLSGESIILKNILPLNRR